MKFRVLLCCLVCLSFSSCAAFAPILQTYGQIGVSKADRMRLLNESVKEFQQAIYWGDPAKALSLSEEESFSDLKRYIRHVKKHERIVESKIEFVDYSDDVYDADVEVLVKYYKVPFYVVTERFEKQSWKFSLASGWKFVSREELDSQNS